MIDPNNIAEQAVLACLLHDNTAFDEISGILKANDFSVPFHQDVFRVIASLIADN